MAIKYSEYSMKKRLLALTLLVIFFAVCIISRLFVLQIVDSEKYIKKGLTQWLRDLPLTATRGSITDRNGLVLASSYTTYDVYVRPADVEDFERVSKLLAKHLNLNEKDIYENITKSKYGELRIAKDIQKETVQLLLQDFEEGIFFTTNTERNYAYDSMLCQVLGFVGYDNAGLGGLESYYDSFLTGIDGVSLVESDLKGDSLNNSVTYYKNAIDGLNLELTIDFRIQNIVENALQKAMNETGAKSASAIVTNPQNNEILALSTLPSYNLNEIPRDDLETFNAYSRATTIVDTFEPGSTFKAIVTAIALEERLVSKHNYFYCGGYRVVNGVTIRCARRSGHGSQSLEKGLMNSCNCVFMDLIAKIGTEKFYDYLDRFGFTSSIGIDFPGEAVAVLMPMPSVTSADLARMGFGQTIALSAMQMVSGFSAVINGGRIVSPHFIKRVVSSSGNEVYKREDTIKEQIFSEETSKTMREMLFSVVSSGGGKNAKVDGFDIIGGKTGTAQKYENGKIAQGKYIASFIGFAPYDNPEFEIYVIIDEPKGAYYGGVVAAPVAGEIFRNIFELFKYNQINNEEYEKFTLDTFIGMTLTQSASKLGELNLQYLTQGDGEFVTGQIPSPGTEVSQGDVVLLIFE
ncbi:MAG: PASTA domain-containing protein [Clostridia bacterium]|nr:PASTA domain-containing protein [Clostridia bacterium]